MDRPKRPSSPINPLVLIGIGLAVIIYSLFISFTVPDGNKDAMFVFTGIGFLFFIFGIFRHLKNNKKDPKKNSFQREEKELINQINNQNNYNNYNNNKNVQTVILCPKCRTKNYSTSNFCHMCGWRLRQ